MDRTDAKDLSLHYVVTTMFNKEHEKMENSRFVFGKKGYVCGGQEMTICSSQEGHLFLFPEDDLINFRRAGSKETLRSTHNSDQAREIESIRDGEGSTIAEHITGNKPVQWCSKSFCCQ